MKSKIDIYLNIDGVVLTKDHRPARHAPEFLEYVISNHPESTYWLTDDSQENADALVQRISHMFDSKTNELLRKIETKLHTGSQAWAIDFTRPFLWLDVDKYPEERQSLRLSGLEDNFIPIDLARDTQQLGKLVKAFPVPISLTMFEPEEIRMALHVIAKHKKAYTTLMQKELRIGYARALNLMIKLEYDGYIEIPRNGSFCKVNFDIIYDA